MLENAYETKESLLKKVLLIIPLVFLVELILGGSGNTIVLGGIAIRKILFALTFISLCLYIIVYARRITIKKIDWFVFAFLFVNVIWITIIPYIKGTSIFTAIDDADTVFVLVLYFPTVFLIRQGAINWERIKKIFIFLTAILAVWHIVMYLLESFFPGIYNNYYESFLPTITFGLFGGESTVFGYGFVRIIKTTSIYLIVAFFYVLGQKEKKISCYIYMSLFLFAIMTTMTRSLLLSGMAGLVVFLIPIHKSMINKQWFKKAILVVVAVVAFVAFNNIIVAPISEMYVQNVYEKHLKADEEKKPLSIGEKAVIDGKAKNQEDVLDRIGSSTSKNDASNKLRTQQTEALVNMWEGSPIVGFGYGSYTKDCIRNPDYPYMYEATFPSLLMKLGVVGVAAWVLFIIVLLYYTFKNKYMNKKYDEFLIWLIASVSFGLSVQTNPFLFTFCGFSLILFFCLDLETGQILQVADGENGVK
jgi:O-antigen ligase